VFASPSAFSGSSGSASNIDSFFGAISDSRSLSIFGSDAGDQRSATAMFLSPRLAFSLSVPDGPLSVGQLIDFFG
jgi:hypothetical protein